MKPESVLKPCPFCGAEAYIADTWDSITKYVQCTVCGCRTIPSENKLEVMEIWNRRIQPEETGKRKKKKQSE